MQKWKFQFSPLLAAILDFIGKLKSVNISKTVRDSAISSDFFDPQGSTGVSYGKGKNFNFRHFWRPSWILAENKH